MRRKKRKGLASVPSSLELRRCGEVVRGRRKRREACLCLIHPKLIAAKKWVKSEVYVAKGMFLGVSDE
jgi:hypothetical protein